MSYLVDEYGNPINSSNPLPMQVTGSNTAVGTDQDATWAASALINTAVNVDYALPAVLQADAKYLVEIYNPSANTALTVVACNKAASFAGADRYPELTRWGVLANTVKSTVVEGWMLDGGSRLTLSNDTALSTGQGFTAKIRVIKV